MVRASSNKPDLVVVCESPISRGRMMYLVKSIGEHLETYPELGESQQVPGP